VSGERVPFCERAAVVGLGLIGGSLARDLASRGVRVSAYDADPSHIREAVRDRVVSEAIDASLEGVRGADVVVIAVPVDAAVDVLRRIAPHVADAKLVTDVGSTKARIVAEARAIGGGLGARFVGSHPLAGDHRSGWSASRPCLFEGAPVYICPGDDTPAELVSRAAALWQWVGARPVALGAEAHDRKLAWTSHLPHVVSTALALALSQGAVGRDELGPGGRDVTRLAGSSPEMWTAIARENAGAIDAALAIVEREIASFRRALAQPDADAVRDRFATARAWFDA
jgi:prephenate dehydrogenase